MKEVDTVFRRISSLGHEGESVNDKEEFLPKIAKNMSGMHLSKKKDLNHTGSGCV